MPKKNSYILLVVSLFFLFLFASILFVDNFISLKEQKTFTNQKQKPHTLSVNQIKPWMTISYLNRTFNLPPTYLQDALKLDTLKYPRLTLTKISSQQGKSTEEIINIVRKSIELYQTSQQQTAP